MVNSSTTRPLVANEKVSFSVIIVVVRGSDSNSSYESIEQQRE